MIFTGCGTNQTVRQELTTITNVPVVATQVPKTTSNQKYSIITTSFSQDSIMIEYPQIKGLGDDSKEKAINDLIKNDILSSQVEEPSKSFKDKPNTKIKLIVNLKYRVTMSTNELLSVVYTGYGYFNVSAHHYKDIHAVTIDLKNLTKLELSNFTTIDNDFIQKIKQSTEVTNDDVKNGNISKEILINKIQQMDEQIIINGFNEKGANYTFYITSNSLGVSVPITPSATGDYALLEIPGNYTVNTEKVNPTNQSPKPTEISNKMNLNYINKKLGFSLLFPESWDGKYTTKEEATGIVVLYNASSKSEKTAQIFGIFIWGSETDWNEWYKKGKDMGVPFRKIGVINGNVFVADGPTQAIFSREIESEKKDAEEYDKLMKDVDSVLETFKSLK